MTASLRKIAKFIGDKLLSGFVAGLVVVAANHYGVFLIEKFKVESAAHLGDSDKLLERAGLLWTKAYEFAAEAADLIYLYDQAETADSFQRMFPAHPKKDYQSEIEQKHLSASARLGEFFDVLNKSQFYIDDAISKQILQYVTYANAMVYYQKTYYEGKKQAEDDLAREQDHATKEFIQSEMNERRQEKTVLFKLTREEMSRLRFDYKTVRRYALDQKTE